MPAIRTYIVTRVQTVSVTTANGYQAAHEIAEAAFDGDPIDAAHGRDLPGYTDGPPITQSIHIDRKS